VSKTVGDTDECHKDKTWGCSREPWSGGGSSPNGCLGRHILMKRGSHPFQNQGKASLDREHGKCESQGMGMSLQAELQKENCCQSLVQEEEP
jgi:hypothetical protein